jgi:hypothetical protein
MRIKLHVVTASDAPDLVAAAKRGGRAPDFEIRLGPRPWSAAVTERGVLTTMRSTTVYIAR